VPGRLSLRLGVIASTGVSEHPERCPDIGPACASASPPEAYWHHVDVSPVETWLDASIGVTPWLAFEARLALRVVDVSPTFRSLSGELLSIPDESHHRDETLVGAPDPWLLARFAGAAGPVQASARVGVTLPLGKTEDDPYLRGLAGLPHQHVQFGTGTVVPVVGASLSGRAGDALLGASAIAFFGLYQNDQGFRPPTRALAGVRAGWSIAGGAFVPSVTLDVLAETPEVWHGRPGEEGPSGRADLLVGLGMAWTPRDPWQIEIAFRRRAASFTDAANLRSPGWLQLAVGTSFDLAKPGKAAPATLDVVPK